MARRMIKKRMKAKQPRSTEKATILINRARMGNEEPIITNGKVNRLGFALNWYTFCSYKKDRRNWLHDFLVQEGRTDDARRVERIPDRCINATNSYMARLMLRGAHFSAEEMERWEKRFQYMLRFEGATPDEDEDEEGEEGEEKREARKPSIQNRVREKASEIIGEVEGMIDDGFDDNFAFDVWFRSKNISPMIAKMVADHFKPVLAEFKETLEGKDPQLKEAYEGYEKDDLECYKEFYQEIIDQCERYASNTKAARAPRMKKPVSVEKKLKFIAHAHLKHSKDYNITSVDPARIIGAQELWTFDTKYKILTVFRAGSMGGQLDISRKKVVGFDKNLSFSKRVGRRPQEWLDKVIKEHKPGLKRLMDDIHSNPIKLQDKIKETTVLARVL